MDMDILGFIIFIVRKILEFLIWAIIINAIMSWLVAFDVINLRNRLAHNVARFFEAITDPVLRPLRRIIPNLGGVDITPLIAILIIQGLLIYIIPQR